MSWQVALQIYDSLSSDFDFEQISDLAGYRKISGGNISGPLNIFAGLDAEPFQKWIDASSIIEKKKIQEELTLK